MMEAEIEESILQYLSYTGWLCWKNISAGYWDASKGHYRKHTSKWAMAGVSDIIAIKNGLVLFLEVKTPKGKQLDTQIAFEKRLKEKGGSYHVVRSIDDLRAIVIELEL